MGNDSVFQFRLVDVTKDNPMSPQLRDSQNASQVTVDKVVSRCNV